MGTTTGVVLVLNFICISVGIAGIVAGAIGHSWWRSENSVEKTEIGLWRSCVTLLSSDDTSCGTSREDVLKFDPEFKDNKNSDILLVLLIGAGFFGVCALITSAAMFCCQNKRTGWLCGSILVICNTLLAAGATLACLIYAELEIKWDSSTRGWSVIATWIGLGMFVMSFTLSIIGACLIPSSTNGGSMKYTY
ncbi:uncharacterized protein [Clytia hemisphaerica]|uniref:Uncharacterized protein n=1 Tax=Clytia hemisphaerica TaxID=252671 RepID=A0A7M5V285_9CNID|eukprot:TCONS_00046403-protein